MRHSVLAGPEPGTRHPATRHLISKRCLRIASGESSAGRCALPLRATPRQVSACEIIQSRARSSTRIGADTVPQGDRITSSETSLTCIGHRVVSFDASLNK